MCIRGRLPGVQKSARVRQVDMAFEIEVYAGSCLDFSANSYAAKVVAVLVGTSWFFFCFLMYTCWYCKRLSSDRKVMEPKIPSLSVLKGAATITNRVNLNGPCSHDVWCVARGFRLCRWLYRSATLPMLQLHAADALQQTGGVFLQLVLDRFSPDLAMES